MGPWSSNFLLQFKKNKRLLIETGHTVLTCLFTGYRCYQSAKPVRDILFLHFSGHVRLCKAITYANMFWLCRVKELYPLYHTNLIYNNLQK